MKETIETHVIKLNEKPKEIWYCFTCEKEFVQKEISKHEEETNYSHKIVMISPFYKMGADNALMLTKMIIELAGHHIEGLTDLLLNVEMHSVFQVISPKRNLDTIRKYELED